MNCQTKTKITALAVLAVFAVCGLTVEALRWEVCDQDTLLSKLNSISVSDCNESENPCIFVKGTNKTIELKFTPNEKLDSAKVKIVGRLSKLDIPFHVSPDNACGNYGLDCPLEAGKEYTFKLSLPILNSYPKINVGVFLRLLTDNKSVITCVKIPAKIE